ncbi:MAG: Crp/Fnr family transcriptional regulator [Casimicrobiaceae bacterium]
MQRTPKQNHLLAALPAEAYERLAPHLELVTLPRGSALYEPGIAPEYAYFPTSSIVSVLSPMQDGSSPEVAIIGNDGVAGIALLMGGAATTNSRAVVQSAGHGFRIRAKVLQSAAEAEAPLRHLMLRYAQCLMTQMAQAAACNRFHSVDQQVCRLLLMCMDRWASNRLSLTHERMSNLLGVRREGVTGASGNLAAAGLISYRRGCVTVLDRFGLEARVCECYAVVKAEAARLLPITPREENASRRKASGGMVKPTEAAAAN